MRGISPEPFSPPRTNAIQTCISGRGNSSSKRGPHLAPGCDWHATHAVAQRLVLQTSKEWITRTGLFTVYATSTLSPSTLLYSISPRTAAEVEMFLYSWLRFDALGTKTTPYSVFLMICALSVEICLLEATCTLHKNVGLDKPKFTGIRVWVIISPDTVFFFLIIGN